MRFRKTILWAISLLTFDLILFSCLSFLIFNSSPFKPEVRWVLLIWLGVLVYEGLYTKRVIFWEEVRGLWKAALISNFLVIILGILKIGRPTPPPHLLCANVVSLLVIHPLLRSLFKSLLLKFGFQRNTLILSFDERVREILKTLEVERLGYKVLGCLSDEEEVGKVLGKFKGKEVKVLGKLDEAEKWSKILDIEDVFILAPPKEKIEFLVDQLKNPVESIHVVPELNLPIDVKIERFFDFFLLNLKNNIRNQVLKRVFDLVFSIVLLPILLPTLGIICILIKLDSKGPVMFSHERIGRGGKRFRCYKFRTMVENAEEILKELLKDQKFKSEWESLWKIKEDPRVTRVGKILRKTGLDELPQIFNVIRGDMSLIGPRPIVEEEAYKRDKSEYAKYISVRPGITGLWQVMGRNEIDYKKRIFLDSWYVQNWSFWLDIVIILKTFKVILTGKGY